MKVTCKLFTSFFHYTLGKLVETETKLFVVCILWYGMVWYGMVWYGMVWYGMVWYGMVWYGMVWYGMVWYAMLCYTLLSYFLNIGNTLAPTTLSWFPWRAFVQI